MKDITKHRLKFVAGGAAVIAFVLFLYAISWLATCGIIKLITMCFGWEFKWAIATGVWLVICVLKTIFKSNVTVKK